MNTNKVAVLGGGSFGTVLANIAASNGSDVSLWVRDSEQALRINSEGANTDYHPELQLSSNIEASEKLDEVVNNASIVLIATPSLIFETIVQRITPYIQEGAHIISCTKGIKLDPFRSMSDIISANINSNTKAGFPNVICKKHFPLAPKKASQRRRRRGSFVRCLWKCSFRECVC